MSHILPPNTVPAVWYRVENAAPAVACDQLVPFDECQTSFTGTGIDPLTPGAEAPAMIQISFA